MSTISVPSVPSWRRYLQLGRQLVVLTWQATERHQTLDRAAILAFYAVLSLVPFLGLAFAVTLGMVEGLADELVAIARNMMPTEAETIIRSQLDKIQDAPPVAVMSISFIMLIWSSSSFFVAIMDAMNLTHSVGESRAWWQRRLRAIVLTLIEAILVLGAALSIVVWPHLLAWLGLSRFAITLATVVQWAIVIVALFLSFSLADYFGPDVDKKWHWLTPGAVLSVICLIAASMGFRLYLQYGSSSSETYGVMAGVIVLLLWFYLAALSLLLGADLNSAMRQLRVNAASGGQIPASIPDAARETLCMPARAGIK